MSSAPNQTQRILTGDTPTGKLHLGHWVGSVERRVELQSSHDCFFILANMHAFTTRADQPQAIREDTLGIVRDLLCMGIDPEGASIFLQSEVPAIAELTFLFSMLLPFNRVMRNPTLKDEIKVKGLGENYPFGFPLYAVGQTADILAFRPVGVPVGEDQVPHLELTREVARRFNQKYCGVGDKVDDHDHVAEGGVFPVPLADVGKVGRLVGIDGQNKMSKSLNNAIYISDTAKQVQKKVNKIFTGRQSPTEPGDPEQQPDAVLRDLHPRCRIGWHGAQAHVTPRVTTSATGTSSRSWVRASTNFSIPCASVGSNMRTTTT